MSEVKHADGLKAEAIETEKHHDASSKALKLHEYKETEGYVVDAETGEGNVKLAKDGHTRLIPQPSEDPRDPLNWTWRQKHIILFIISFVAFLPDFGSATGAVTLLPQAAYVPTIGYREFLPRLTWSQGMGNDT
jgi:hypothetical protein